MSSLVRKLQKRLRAEAGASMPDGPGQGEHATPYANVIMKLNPKTGEMQEYHFTKGWRN